MYSQTQEKSSEWSGEREVIGVTEVVNFHRTGIQKGHLAPGALPHREQSECW